MLKINQIYIRTFVIIFIVVILCLGFITYFWYKNIYIEQISKNLIQNINTFSLSIKNLDNIDNIIKNLKKQNRLRITIIDQKGNIVAESDKHKELMENHSNRIEILGAKDGDFAKSIRHSKTLNKELLYIAKKVFINKQTYYIRMADYIDKINEDFLILSSKILALILLFLIIVFITNYIIGLKIKNQTDLILDFLVHLTSKKTSLKLDSSYSYEFYKISKLLNKVSKKLIKRNHQKAKQTALLKLSNKQKDEIISAISHEFKNPIAIITGYSQTILDDENMPKNMRNKFIDKISKNANKMSLLIDKLRLSLKLEQGKQNINIKEHLLKDIIENIIYDLQDKYPNRHITFTHNNEKIKADKTLLAVAIENLLDNALKYSDDEVSINLEDNYINIIDKGIGIDTSDLKNIQNKFYRVSSNGWDNSMGLGLFIVKSILILHKFELKIDSQLKNGSKFTIIY